MICNLTIGATVIELAGGNGRESETSGLRIDTETNFERVAYLGVTDGRQFARPGSYVSASFSSIQTFSTVQAAETYVLSLPADLADQNGATAEVGRSTPAIIIAGTLTIDGSTPATSGASYLTGTANGKPSYTGDKWDITWTTDFPTIGQNAWVLDWTLALGGEWYSTSNTATPDLATGWTAVSPATGTPTVTAGAVIDPSLTIYDAQANVSASHRGCAVTLDVQISGRLTAP
jgi:hypothetical protein